MEAAPGQFRTIVNDDGAVVLDTALGTIATLNPTGWYIWRALEQGQHHDAIVAALVHDTGASQEIVERDVREFLSALTQHHMFRS